MWIPDAILKKKLLEFLAEDIGSGDITSNAVIPEETMIHAQIIAKESFVVAGIYEVETLFRTLNVTFKAKVKDGDEVCKGTVIAEVEGHGRSILSAERTALNILMRMCGIATASRNMAKMIQNAGLKVRIAATRKTAPGLRYFDKRAVMTGGGNTHRVRLDDAFLIKDNHIKVAGGVREALQRVRATASFSKKIEVEAKTKEEAIQAATLGADIVMLDNMTLEKVRETMKALNAQNLRDKVLVEISGGITRENLLDYARLKPDIISLGSLTHSVKAVDISLEVVSTFRGKQSL